MNSTWGWENSLKIPEWILEKSVHNFTDFDYSLKCIEEIRARIHSVTLLFVDFSGEFDFIHRVKMEQILQAYGILDETVTSIKILYKDPKPMVY